MSYAALNGHNKSIQTNNLNTFEYIQINHCLSLSVSMGNLHAASHPQAHRYPKRLSARGRCLGVRSSLFPKKQSHFQLNSCAT
jgi:hypothetical protein